jgi:hypothetical protein
LKENKDEVQEVCFDDENDQISSPPYEYNNLETSTLSQTLDNLEMEEFVEVSLEKEKLCGSIDLDQNLEGESYQFFCILIHIKLRTR